MDEPHIHKVHDGRGRRKVLCDGEVIHSCVYADTQRGIVRFHGEPRVLNAECDGFLIHERYGKVEVFFVPETIQVGGRRPRLKVNQP